MKRASNLPWTGERMIPCHADAATEMFHWQRYLFFQPWYQDKTVIDAASGEGYGADYASMYAKTVTGYDIAADAVKHAKKAYAKPHFEKADVLEVDFSKADFVTSFETIEHLTDPEGFLKALAKCRGVAVVSTPNRNIHSPGNRITDRPQNEFHTVEWTPSEFASIVRLTCQDRPVRFLSQAAQWPGTITEGLNDQAMYVIAVIGEGETPKWPKLGFTIPTHNGADRVVQAVLSFTKFYPGELKFVVVANGCRPEELAKLRAFAKELPHVVELVVSCENVGFAGGVNLGLAELAEGGFDYYGVTNDDVTPDVNCLIEMVSAMVELEKQGFNPGVVGPVSNNVTGGQQVKVEPYADLEGMYESARVWRHEKHESITQTHQLRGLCLLLHPKCLEKVGGFDPRFGLGNFEDDDYNLRTHFAGLTTWIAEGAFLHHDGSATFRSMHLDYQSNIQRNMSLILEKWGAKNLEQLWSWKKAPKGSSLFQSFETNGESSGFTMQIGPEKVDLVHQATPTEFAAYVMQRLQDRPREDRLDILKLLERDAA